ncbi:sugar ABC transporter substrate-binding protein [Tissierella sp. MB52-C2]|uniref:ABC transporter substrate-binding protein n=1 Tax=Tissierella sp. MB52-C2 TaxID=3070999 RepID=UPI00280A9E9A|nr:sugar ABC transporter substrate-binding protein [Tissierella sp. MB52-C2]WMM23467.1 sugar ABC transporter substrate-binding protein [Tissierella sp. MB52-C2]
MKIKRSLSILLVVMMLVAIVAGCTKKDSDGSADGKTTLTFGLWDKYQEPIMRELADMYEAKNENIKIDIQLTPYGQYWTKLETAATGEVLPDIFWINGPNIVKYAANDMLVPLDELVESNNIDLSVYPEGLIDLYTVDGKLYGIPKDWDLTALWYNKKLFDEKGVEYPNENWTWDDMVEAARKLTDKEKGIYGIAARPDTQEGIYDTIPQAGGYIISEDRKTSGYDTKEALEGTKIWIDLLEEGLSPTLEEQADTNAIELFKGEKVAMVYAASWNVPVFMQNEVIKDHIDLTIMPLIKERAATIHGLSNAIAANSKHKDEAWDFVKFLGSKEANEVWAKSGVVIPAHKEVLDIWEAAHPEINLKAFVDELDYAVMYPVSLNTSKWNDVENEYIKQIWNRGITVEEGLKKISELMNEALTKEQ